MADWKDMERRVRDRIGDALLNARADQGEYYNLRKIADDTADEITRWWADVQEDALSAVVAVLSPLADHRERMPSYADLKRLHDAVFRDGWAYQVFAPPSDHVNLHEFCLHLFGLLDGKPVLPDFTNGSGSI